MRILIALAAAAIAAPAAAQTAATIDPGMTRAQVVAKLGEPLSVRTYDGHTYLLYKNGCEKKCGMNDLVVLDSGKVIDAVFRSPARHYSGTSSSPRMMSAVDAKHEAASPLTVPDTTAKKPEMPAKKAD
ncbi:MAG: outer membrane protein assembly factor BamE, partial [Gemmatimonas sp.]